MVETPNVYKLVGGNDYEHYLEDPQVYANAFALRLIRAFNYGGMVIQKGPGAYKLRGGDGKAYIMRVSDMIKYVSNQFGAADMTINGNGNVSQLNNKKGILVFTISGWGDATGHVTLWNGNDCGDRCYFTHTQQGVTTQQIQFWELK